MEFTFIDSPVFHFGVLPLLIFCSRIIDVSIGTMRVIFVSKGYKVYAGACGFFEVLIWLVAMTQIMNNLTNPLYYVAYAGGFATGNFVGMMIEEKIALGNVLLRVVSKNEFVDLIAYLQKEGYGVTFLPAQGLHGSVKVLFTIIPRTRINDVVAFIKQVNPQAFYTIEDVRFVNDQNIAFQTVTQRNRTPFWKSARKGK